MTRVLRGAPRLARRLLCALLPGALVDDVAANLDDLYAIRARTHGQAAADLWYWRQALACPLRLRLSGALHDSTIPPKRTTIMRGILQDLRHAVRLHRAHPGVALVAVVSLAVGIGLNTAIFSVVDGVLLRRAPIAGLDRLVMVWETDRNTGTTREPGSLPDLLDYRDRARQVEPIGALIATEVNLTPTTGAPVRLATLMVTPDVLPLVGVHPIAGRAFDPHASRPGTTPVLLISESLATRQFGAATAAVGQTLRVNDRAIEVIGVVPDVADFGVMQLLASAAYSRSFADRGTRTRVDAWMPLVADTHASPRSTHPLFMVGRLAAGATAAQAQDELAKIAADLERTYHVDNHGRGVYVEPLADVIFGPIRPAFFALLGGVGLVLLVACANVANLLLAKGAARRREIAVRSALGAGSWRIVRQFLTEAVALSLTAAIAGVGIAYVVVRWLVAQGPASIPRLASASIDVRVLAVTLLISVAAGLLFGVFPALQARRSAPASALGAESGRTQIGGRDQSRLRTALVVTEIALATALVCGAGLLIKSFWRLYQTDPGFRSAGVYKAEYQLPSSRYPANFSVWPNFKEMHAFTAALLERVQTLPGIDAYTVAGNHPLDPGFTTSFVIVGREAEAGNQAEMSIRRVTQGYFDTVGMTLVSGRVLADGDTVTSAPVLVVNQATADRFFPGRDPLGQQIRFWGTARRIVGVVRNEKFQGIASASPPAVYVPLAQAPSANGAGVLLVRTRSRDAANLSTSLARVIRDVDPGLAVFAEEALDVTVTRSTAERRFTMILLGLFAAMALGLAALGIHSVLSYSVSQRTREIGIRLALGASPGRLRRLIVRDGLLAAALGLALGLAGALALGGLLRKLLFGVSPTDPWTFAAVAAVLIAVAATASYFPARRISKIDPNDALRDTVTT